MYSIKYYYIRGSTNWYRQPVALEGTSKQVTGNKEKTEGVTGNKSGGRKATNTDTGLVQVDIEADLRLGKPGRLGESDKKVTSN